MGYQLTGAKVPAGSVSTSMELLDMDSLVGKLQKSLSTGPTHFVYRKSDGTMRSAIGTTSADHFPQKTAKGFNEFMDAAEKFIERSNAAQDDATGVVGSPKAEFDAMVQTRLDFIGAYLDKAIAQTERKKNVEQVNYFDLGIREWRSFKRDMLVCVFD